jgi:hypothetical protein
MYQYNIEIIIFMRVIKVMYFVLNKKVGHYSNFL